MSPYTEATRSWPQPSSVTICTSWLKLPHTIPEMKVLALCPRGFIDLSCSRLTVRASYKCTIPMSLPVYCVVNHPSFELQHASLHGNRRFDRPHPVCGSHNHSKRYTMRLQQQGRNMFQLSMEFVLLSVWMVVSCTQHLSVILLCN
jgi:hypothetical protein